MEFTHGIHAKLQLRYAAPDQPPQPLELAIGPSDTLGDLESVVARFAEAYALSVQAETASLGDMRMCLFDRERLLVAFDQDADGNLDADDAMSKRFAFAFIGQMDDEPSELDPWLVVRPCTKRQVQVWHELMELTGPQVIQAFCLDAQLSGFFEVG
ncbi:MAG: hypothetical protein ACOCXA_10050 [Planctomycetota bacterium]